jgi:hypothetical protein
MPECSGTFWNNLETGEAVLTNSRFYLKIIALIYKRL